jgi:hypothetical protein
VVGHVQASCWRRREWQSQPPQRPPHHFRSYHQPPYSQPPYSQPPQPRYCDEPQIPPQEQPSGATQLPQGN